jgi:hypothetical protein
MTFRRPKLLPRPRLQRKPNRVRSLTRVSKHPSQKRGRSVITTEAAAHLLLIAVALTTGAITAVFVPIRGRFRVSITARIAIHTTGYMAGIAIDLVSS